MLPVKNPDTWFSSPLGETLKALEERQVAAMLGGAPDGPVMQLVSPLGTLEPNLYRAHQWLLEGRQAFGFGATARPMRGLVAEFDALPVATGSLAALVLAHALEAVPDPGAVLAEAERVLQPEGVLVISGFNPWSLSVLLRWRRLRSCGRRQTNQSPRPWQAHFRSLGLLRRYLRGRGLEIEQLTSVFYRLPLERPWALRHGQRLERIGARVLPQRGAVYLLMARRRVALGTPIRLTAPELPGLGKGWLPGQARHSV